MAPRHPILLSLWGMLILSAAFAIAARDMLWLGLALLASPIVALATLAAVHRRVEREVLRARWAVIYRVVLAAIALAGLAGVVGASSQIVSTADAGTSVQNGPIAVLFLAALLSAWPALVRPTPRRAAMPAALIQVLWLPLLLVNSHERLADWARWQRMLTGVSLLGVLVLSVVAAMLSLYVFVGSPRIAEARRLLQS